MTTLLGQLSTPRLRGYWRRLVLQGAHYADQAAKLDRLYCVENPWQMQSAREQARFGWTNKLITDWLGPLDTILEIGCGEGHQSQHLTRLCRRLYGIDVSIRAVRRAAARCPEGKFGVGDPFGSHFADMPVVVDLVVACEMLYYVKSVPILLDRIARLGKACLVTYFSAHAATLDPFFAALPGREREEFCFEGVTWIAVRWHNSDNSKTNNRGSSVAQINKDNF